LNETRNDEKKKWLGICGTTKKPVKQVTDLFGEHKKVHKHHRKQRANENYAAEPVDTGLINDGQHKKRKHRKTSDAQKKTRKRDNAEKEVAVPSINTLNKANKKSETELNEDKRPAEAPVPPETAGDNVKNEAGAIEKPQLTAGPAQNQQLPAVSPATDITPTGTLLASSVPADKEVGRGDAQLVPKPDLAAQEGTLPPTNECKEGGDAKPMMMRTGESDNQPQNRNVSDDDNVKRGVQPSEDVVNKSLIRLIGDFESKASNITAAQTEVDEKRTNQVQKIRSFVRTLSEAGQNGIREAFMRCKDYIPTTATRTSFDANQDRVRYPDVICIDQTRVVLKNCPDGSDFIHASRVPIGDSQHEMIITQVPLANTVKHFWQMVWQEKAEAILLILTTEEWKTDVEPLNLVPSKL
uniref:Tyrosine-protein phosphatase domain-containing protein n=1 Tax=Anisakis simplex TaxID=6269 RepID=A0A0M3J0U5_ANISI